MSFFTPRFITEARLLAAAAKKIFNYQHDLWTQEQCQEFQASLQKLHQAIQSRSPAQVATSRQAVESVLNGALPRPPHQSYQAIAENIEAIVIAIILAIGFQTYFFKPFKIPTGSMQPTLYGMTAHPQTEPSPSALRRTIDFLSLGRSYVQLQASHDEEVLALQEKTILNFFTFTTISTSQGEEKLFAPRDVVIRDFGIVPGRYYHQGEIMAQGYVQAGDQIFVDRVSYAFKKPKNGDVFVFVTSNIEPIERTLPPGQGSQYYIKRLAGLPGDTLRIDPPTLFLNGSKASQPGFLKVMSEKNRYRGYSNRSDYGTSPFYLSTPDASFTVPMSSYFALGDNSFNSSDSRYWGVVPEQNVIGRGCVVYWPLSSRWGWIR